MMRHWCEHGMVRMSVLADENKDGDLDDKEGETHKVQDGTHVEGGKKGQGLKRSSSSNSVGSETSKSSRRSHSGSEASKSSRRSQGTLPTVNSEAKAEQMPPHAVKGESYFGPMRCAVT